MPCYLTPNGVLCTGNEPVSIEHNGRTYRFEWSAGCGWLPCNKDGSQRLLPVPVAVWEKLEAAYPKGGK